MNLRRSVMVVVNFKVAILRNSMRFARNSENSRRVKMINRYYFRLRPFAHVISNVLALPIKSGQLEHVEN